MPSVKDDTSPPSHVRKSKASGALAPDTRTHHTAEGLYYRPEIDGLRAVAVLVVLGFHAFPKDLSGGFVGVDVFFVISGYLISSIILRQLAKGQFTLTDFYARRARRILPALCVVLGVCLLFGYFALLPDELDHLGKQGFAAAVFAANFALWRESGYFAPSAELQPFLHLWSLGIEEQFYLLWPLIMLLGWKRRWNIVWVTLGLAAASFALNIVLAEESPSADYYFPFSRFWELAIGCLLAAYHAARVENTNGSASLFTLPRALAEALPLVGIGLIVFAAFAFDSETPFPGAAALLPTLGAACIIAAPGSAWLSRGILASRPFVWVGLISYPLYLWHWPLISFATILHSDTPSPRVRAACVVLSLILATLTYRLIELPVRRHARGRVSLALVGAMAVLGAVGLVAALNAGFPKRYDINLAAIREHPRQTPGCAGTVSGVSRFNYCKRVGEGATEVVFLGDSQAQGVFEGAAAVLGNQHSMLLLGHGGCPPGMDVTKTSRVVYSSTPDRRECNAAWREFANYVHATRPRMVVLVGAGSRFFTAIQDKRSPRYLKLDGEAFKAGLSALIADLQPSTKVVYMLEIPTFQTPPRCFLRPMRLPGDSCKSRIPRTTMEADRATYTAAVQAIQAAHPGMVVFDPIPSLCNPVACSERTRAGDLLYRDRLHLSPAGGLRLARDSGLARFIAEGNMSARSGTWP